MLLAVLLCGAGTASATLACSPGTVHTYHFESTVEKSIVELPGDHTQVFGKVTVADVLLLSVDAEGWDQQPREPRQFTGRPNGAASGAEESDQAESCLRVMEVHLTGSVGEGGDPTSQSLPLPPVAIFQRDTGVPFA